MDTNLLKKIDYSNEDPLNNDMKMLKDLQDINDISAKQDTTPELNPTIQELVNQLHSSYKFPKPFIVSGMLAATSAAIGNSCIAEVKEGFCQPAMISILNVAPPGGSKTPPMKWTLQPLYKQDAEAFKIYKARKKEFDELNAIPRKERQDTCRPEPVKPIYEKLIISDATMEATLNLMQFNPRGLMLVADEAMGFFANMNRYNKGSDQEYYLQIWSGSTVSVDRKHDEPIFVERPYLTFIGNIQPKVLLELNKGAMTSNGYIERILFMYPESVPKEPWDDEQLPPEVPNKWAQILNRVSAIPLNKNPLTGVYTPTTLKFTHEARTKLFDWQGKNAALINQEDEKVAGIYSKLELQVVRLSLILQILKWACDEETMTSISAKTVNSAIQFTEYFRETAMKVNSILSNVDATDSLVPNKKEFVESLPDGEFETKVALGLAAAMTPPVSQRTAERILKDKTLFTRVRFGVYAKK